MVDARHWGVRAAWVVLFGVAFGYVEAAVVVYLREIYDPLRASLHPGLEPGALLPLITTEQLREAGGHHLRTLLIELGREVATLMMLAAVAGAARRRRGEWIAFFMIAFGTWDLAYYAGLKAMIGFPASLLTWDLLFLVPVPWLGPVLAPVLVSFTMIGAALVVLREAAAGSPPRGSGWHVAGIALGALLIVASFCKDYAATAAGKLPEAFDWALFGAGLSLGIVAFGLAVRRGRRGRRRGRDDQRRRAE